MFNIMVGLTIIAFLVLAVQLIHSKVTTSQALFFHQKIKQPAKKK